MKTVLAKLAVWAVIVAASWQWTLPVQAAGKGERAEAAKLVDETLRREAREGIEDRREVLRPALELTPACEAAYGPSGFAYDVKRKEWLLPSEIQELAAKDARLAEYRAARAKFPDTEKGQAELARWCARRKLDDQARAHWTKVLSFNAEQPEARRQLGFQKVNGTWLGQQEIANARAKVSDFRTSLTQWGRKLEDALKRLGGPNRQASDVARQELKRIKVPDAVPAIEVVFCANGGEYAPLGIELLKQMKAAQAAEALAWLAAFSPCKPVQKAATEALKDQSPHDYVPLLLGAMRVQVQSNYALYNTLDGGFVMRRALYENGPEERQLVIRDYVYTPELSHTSSVNVFKLRQDPASVRSYNHLVAEDQKRQQADMIAAKAKAQAKAARQQATIAVHNVSVSKENSRLCQILTVATGDSQATSPDDWYSWWNDYNEISQQGDKPFLITYETRRDPVVTVALAPALRTCSCLVAGTPVWTELGPVAVEQIKVGDRVLACDCDSGQLMLKPVLKTIINPGKEIFRLHTKNETLEVTGGHVFWIAGKGWIKARQLKPEMRFHTLKGTVDLTKVEQHGKQDTYNLVVADYHSYFVGKEKILTHDNTIRKPTNCVVPGLAAHAAETYP